MAAGAAPWIPPTPDAVYAPVRFSRRGLGWGYFAFRGYSGADGGATAQLVATAAEPEDKSDLDLLTEILEGLRARLEVSELAE